MLTNENKVLTHNDKWLEPEINAYYYNPLNLPPYTIRVVYKNGTKPVLTGQYGYWAGNNYRVNPNLVTMKQISSVPNVWDITYSTDQWIYLFYEEVNLLKVLGANTTGVTNMNGLFNNCHNLNEVALFDTSSVVDMGGMFGNSIVFSSGYYDGHSSLETIPLFDTHNVTNMSGMFDSAPGLKYVPNLNTSKVTNMGRMFAFCFGLEETPLLDTKSATYIDEMFYKCTGLKKINEFAFTSVNSCNYIFSNCYNVESGMLEMYDTLRNAYTGRETRVGYDHHQAFKNCGFTHKYVDGVWSKVYASEDSQYAQAHILDTWGGEMVKRHVYTTGTNGTVSAVPNYDYPETTVTLSNTPNEGYEFDSYSVTGATIYDGNKLDIGYSDVNVHGNFNGIVRTITCTGDHGTVIATPNTGIIGDTITLSNVPDTNYALDYYTVNGATLYDTNKFDIGTSNVSVTGTFKYVDPYNPLDLPANTIRVRTNNNLPPSKYSYTTYETATLVSGTTDVYDVYKSGTNFESVLSGSGNVTAILGANLSNVTNLYRAFADCNKLTSVALFDTSNVTNMCYTFYNCTRLTSVPLFDTSNVTTMEYTFCNCGNLTSLPLFNLSKVGDLLYTFNNCSGLTSLPLFDTSKAVIMGYTFSGCTNLTSIPLFNTTSVVNMNGTFSYCYNVEHGALALYQQLSSQSRPPTNHATTFYQCGRDTVSGAAELAQIPRSWGGTGS